MGEKYFMLIPGITWISMMQKKWMLNMIIPLAQYNGFLKEYIVNIVVYVNQHPITLTEN